MKTNKEYKKINLRNFRHNLSELKDSLDAGDVYEVTDRGKPFAYFIPVQYDVKLKKKFDRKSEPLGKVLTDLIGAGELKDEIKHLDDYDEAYRFLLEKKYLK